MKISKLAKALEQENEEPKEVRKVAKVKKVGKAEAEEKDTKAKKAAKSNGKAEAKEAKGNGKGKPEAKKGGRTQEVPEGHTSVADLAKEAGITPQSARVKLRGSDIERPEGRWVWEDGSKGLKKAREILGL